MSSNCVPRFFSEICHRYARVLLDLPDSVLKELDSFVQWVKRSPTLWSFITEPELSDQWKQNIFNLFYQKTSCSSSAMNTLKVLGHHARLNLLPNILQLTYQLKKGEKDVYLTLPERLDPASLAQFSKKLSSLWGASVTLHHVDDPSLLLGGILLWDDSMIDTSLRSTLSTLKKEVLHAVSCS
jgi:ATP synthase F1 delta subunit